MQQNENNVYKFMRSLLFNADMGCTCFHSSEINAFSTKIIQISKSDRNKNEDFCSISTSETLGFISRKIIIGKLPMHCCFDLRAGLYTLQAFLYQQFFFRFLCLTFAILSLDFYLDLPPRYSVSGIKSF